MTATSNLSSNHHNGNGVTSAGNSGAASVHAGKPVILVVDDNLEMARMLADELGDRGYEGVGISSGKKAIEMLSQPGNPIDIVVTDLRMPDADGMQILAASKANAPERPVIVMTAYSAVDTAVEAIQRGAFHYITKPFKPGELMLFVARALDDRRVRREALRLKAALREVSLPGMVARSESMKLVVDMIQRVARSSVPVLLTGETGTGKTLAARAIHAESDRASGPFVVVNCAALPETLLESELFGHVRGAFTGAQAARTGLFLEADHGTLLLDEIGDMAPAVQAKLLHVLERGAVRPVGAEKEHSVDVRVIAATNKDLADAAKKGSFREDLLFRLDVVRIDLPPLRRRREDIIDLATRFLDEAKERHKSSPVERFSSAVLDAFLSAHWQGNVRELQHVIERLVVLGRGKEIDVRDVPAATLQQGAANGHAHNGNGNGHANGNGNGHSNGHGANHASSSAPSAGAAPAEEGPLRPLFRGDIIPVRKLQRMYAHWALEQVGGHRGRCAERLDVDGKTLAKWLADPDVF